MSTYDNVLAEIAVLGSVIDSREYGPEALEIARPEMFYRPGHQDLAELLARMIANGEVVEFVTVLQECVTAGILNAVGGADGLHQMQRASNPPQAAYYAALVREAFQARSAREAAHRLQGMLDESSDPADLPALLAMHVDAVADLVESAHAKPQAPAMSVAELLRRPRSYNWQVEGLLERRDRLIWTGVEGHGKSTFLRELGACMAAGVHPDGLVPTPPQRVLVVDVENSMDQNGREYDKVVRAVQRIADRNQTPVDWDDALRIEHCSSGLSLVKPADQLRLERLMHANRPDVLVIGPLYKLYAGTSVNEEEAASRLVDFLEGIRNRYDCTLLIEAHSPHGKGADGDREVRPRGSSLFLGWPEFGMGIRRSKEDPRTTKHPQIVDVIAWRGDRDDGRKWPLALRRGQPGRDLPWVWHDPQPLGQFGQPVGL